MKQLGVIGGLGPMATAYFMQTVTDMTEAATDQQHLPMAVISRPDTPDRTAYILGKSDNSPLPYMLESGKALEALGVACMAIPCVTAHYFHAELTAELKTEVIHAPRETVRRLKEAGVTAAGIMATEGTVRAGIFQKELEAQGIRAVLPDEKAQAAITSTIYDYVKASKRADMELFGSAEHMLRHAGAQCLILGCTELSVVKRDNSLRGSYIDVLEVLAAEGIERCGAQLKEKYRSLIF